MEVIIVGGGIVGSSVAYHLAVEGHSVTLIERRGIAAEASGASAGGVRQIARHPLEVPFAVASVARWPGLADELDVELGYRQSGGLRLARTQEQLDRLVRMINELRALGVSDLVWVDERTSREIIPGLGEGFLGGAYCPSDGSVDPTLATRAFAVAAYRHGAALEVGRRVRRLRVLGDRVAGVVFDDGEFRGGDVVVNAAGAWAGALHEGIGPALPIVTRGPQMLATVPLEQRLLVPVVAAHDARGTRTISLKQLPCGRFMIGGGWPSATDDAGAPVVDHRHGGEAFQAAVDVLPALTGLPIERFWFGWEAETVDALPVLDPVEGVAGYVLALGFSGHGLAIAPAVGQAIADVVLGREPHHPLEPLGIGRFAESGAIVEPALPQPDAG